MPAKTTPDSDLDALRAQRIEHLRQAGQPHQWQAPPWPGSKENTPCQLAGCGLAPNAEVHVEPPPASRREQDQQRRQAKAKAPPPKPAWAPVLVIGNPSGVLDVQVGAGSLPCASVHIERSDNDQGFLVLKIPLPHCEVNLRQAAARPRLIRGPEQPVQVAVKPDVQEPSHEGQDSIPDVGVGVPEARQAAPKEPAAAPLSA